MLSKVNRFNVRWTLVIYDVCLLALSCFLLLLLHEGGYPLEPVEVLQQFVLALVCILAARFAMNIYRQIWRYGGIQSYIKLLTADGMACVVYYLLQLFLPMKNIPAVRLLALCCMNLLLCIAMRMCYRYAYLAGDRTTGRGKFFALLLRLLGGPEIKDTAAIEQQKIKIAIVGAGRVGTGLAEELLNNVNAAYIPRCFIDVSEKKIGRQIYDIPVIAEEAATVEFLRDYGVQEIVFALPRMEAEEKKRLYEHFRRSGCKIKNYDYPTMQTAGSGRRHLREFDIEELLFRDELDVTDERTSDYYHGKRVLITGGGGSIGSELCRQIAKMGPEKLVILDVYENGAYDVQQELRIAYGKVLTMQVEIVSVCNRAGLERVFAEHRPQIVLHAAAHKHVPLMERNCIEAVENNVFGTLNTVELSERYGVERFIMVSTDKAVNPTNVMGATKRMCEMIVQAHSVSSSVTTFSTTRFGNVLGSAGSVIPLFKKQIASGGPVTLTDRRIIRYFMTIPEASQLVLQSGAMAKNGELFVLDMGKPIKILELAENMIRLSGMEPYKDIEIIETGLRPGEKLYEELLVKTEELDKTENSLIFIERDAPAEASEVKGKLERLRAAVASGSDAAAKEALREVVPTFRRPEEVNATAAQTEEMKQASLV